MRTSYKVRHVTATSKRYGNPRDFVGVVAITSSPGWLEALFGRTPYTVERAAYSEYGCVWHWIDTWERTPYPASDMLGALSRATEALEAAKKAGVEV